MLVLGKVILSILLVPVLQMSWKYHIMEIKLFQCFPPKKSLPPKKGTSANHRLNTNRSSFTSEVSSEKFRSRTTQIFGAWIVKPVVTDPRCESLGIREVCHFGR